MPKPEESIESKRARLADRLGYGFRHLVLTTKGDSEAMALPVVRKILDEINATLIAEAIAILGYDDGRRKLAKWNQHARRTIASGGKAMRIPDEHQREE